MRAVNYLGWGGAGIPDLKNYVSELQSMKPVAATGAGAATNITVTGMAAGDYVLAVINATDWTNVSLGGLVVSTNAFKVTADTTGKNLLVFWAKKA